MKQRTNLAEDLINQMFIIAGHKVSYDDIIGRKDDWYCQWTMTDDQRPTMANSGPTSSGDKTNYMVARTSSHIKLVLATIKYVG